MEIRKLIEHE